MRFHWNYEDEMDALKQQAADDAEREKIRLLIEDDYGDRVANLNMWFPWLSPGAVIGMTKMGVSHDTPEAIGVADLEFQRRTAQKDWVFPGDDMKAPGGLPTTELFGGVTHAAQEEESPADRERAAAGQVLGQDTGTQTEG